MNLFRSPTDLTATTWHVRRSQRSPFIVAKPSPINSLARSLALGVLVGALLAALPAVAQTGGGYDLTWSTIDGGGATFSTGGGYSLGGTMGQPDAGPAAGPMTGGNYELAGGFWPAAVCSCPADMNFDQKKNGQDVQEFVACYLLSAGTNCGCADINRDGLLNTTDVSLFVTGLLTPGTCP